MENLNIKQFDPIQAWIDSVALSHTRCGSTGQKYRYYLKVFSDFIGKTAEQIVKEYETNTNERSLRRKYAKYLQAFLSHLNGQGYAIGTITTYAVGIKSFFKYSDLPLGFVPTPRNKVTFHNRDITKEEIQRILEISKLREKAIYTMMAQSGLRPYTLCELRIKNIEPDFSEGVTPCKIEVPEDIAKGEFGAYFTFMGEEAVKYLKAYLATRGDVDQKGYIFTSQGVDRKANTKSISKLFVKTIERLKRKGLIDFEQKAAYKPRTVRLYTLRKFFRKYAGQAGIEYVNFWMGHKTNYKAPHIPSSDVYYFSREDVEFQRQLYKEKAMPFLRVETSTPSETEQTIVDLRRQIGDLQKEMNSLRTIYKNMYIQLTDKDIIKMQNNVIEALSKKGLVTHKEPKETKKQSSTDRRD